MSTAVADCRPGGETCHAKVFGRPRRYTRVPERDAVCSDAGREYGRWRRNPVDHPAGGIQPLDRRRRGDAGRSARTHRGAFQRVRQMEEEGIIEGYALKVNHEKLGIETKAYITLVIHREHRGAFDAQKQIQAMEEVQSCDRITGDDCLCVLGYFRNNRHLIAFLEKISEYGTSKTSIILEV